MMTISQGKLGIKGFDIEKIRKWVINSPNLSDYQVLYGREGKAGREDAMADILANRLRIWPREIKNNLREVYVIVEEGNLTVWVVAPRGFIKRIFNTAARVKDPDYSFTSYIPAAERNKRIAIEEKLKVQKQSDPDLNII